jgi:hypothetical protein
MSSPATTIPRRLSLGSVPVSTLPLTQPGGRLPALSVPVVLPRPTEPLTPVQPGGRPRTLSVPTVLPRPTVPLTVAQLRSVGQSLSSPLPLLTSSNPLSEQDIPISNVSSPLRPSPGTTLSLAPRPPVFRPSARRYDRFTGREKTKTVPIEYEVSSPAFLPLENGTRVTLTTIAPDGAEKVDGTYMVYAVNRRFAQMVKLVDASSDILAVSNGAYVVYPIWECGGTWALQRSGALVTVTNQMLAE